MGGNKIFIKRGRDKEMIGPFERRVVLWYCEGCEMVISRDLAGKILKPRTVFYCIHPKQSTQVSCIKKYPATPEWCPARASRKAKKEETA